MTIFSYIVARDYGFAPNPFYGYCTLATCKPRIRSSAAIGDWVVGTGAKTKYNYSGRLIYAMQVSEILNFDDYWNDPRFRRKRPVVNGSLKQIYGDNIYHSDNRHWIQLNSHHSLENGTPNKANIDHDTNANRVLVASRFVYFGESAPVIPDVLRVCGPSSVDLCCVRQGHRRYVEHMPAILEQWLMEQGKWGLQGLPLEFKNHPRQR